jgi:hypothetical protein
MGSFNERYNVKSKSQKAIIELQKSRSYEREIIQSIGFKES